MSIPVICDRCRSTGIAGEADFSHIGDLLDFKPVPRKTTRVDGWNEERQRAFIAALAATGSKRQAAQAIDMAPFGVDQLLKAEGNESFKAAFDRAMAIAEKNGSMKLAQGVADAAARNAQLTPPSRLRGLDPVPEPEAEMSDDQKWELIESIGTKFMKTVAKERRARLDGQIVAADFYLRQVTVTEVMLDLMSADFGFDAREVLRDLRRGGHKVQDIASTELTDWLDSARRLWWAQEGEPDRPPYPDVRFLKRHRSDDGDYHTAVDQNATGALTTPARGYSQGEWAKLSAEEQHAARKRQFDDDAAEQREWERRAHEQAAEWRDRISPSPQEGEGGTRASAWEGEHGPAQIAWMLVLGWFASVVGLCSLTFSYFEAGRHIRRRHEQIYELEVEEPLTANLLNSLALWSFPVALVSTFAFAAVNIANMSQDRPPPPNPAVEITRGITAPLRIPNPQTGVTPAPRAPAPPPPPTPPPSKK